LEENNKSDLALLEEVLESAGEIAMKYFKSENEVWLKAGDSPVSQADMEVNSFLQQRLLAARPDYGWLSEENEDNDQRLARRLECQRVFVVDPIDGTRGFIDGQDQWCISVGIVENARPVAAILECPALEERFTAIKDGASLLNGKSIAVRQTSQISRATGSNKINEILTNSPATDVKAIKFVPSLAYRLAMVADGRIDVAFARPGSHDWDIAAADLILTNAGGILADCNSQPLRYNRKKIRRESLIACHSEKCAEALELAKTVGILH